MPNLIDLTGQRFGTFMVRGPDMAKSQTPIDWYERRDELDPGQVFKMYDGSVVKLDRTVPGDATAWIVADWWNGWSYMESHIEPGDLIERLPDNYAGASAERAVS